ncbi:MAG TPA: ATP-binding protein [Terriglobales bacterium]|nr:ATP-binding protein [Terriglobales bacterium]
MVVGGGLASIDVVKILQLENYQRVLRARGIPTDVYELEKKGVPAVCKMHGIAPEDLGVKRILLIYRRRGQDMPLAQPPENATPDQIAKTEAIRQKMLRLAQDKYLFPVKDRKVSTGLLIEDGRLVGLKVAETRVEGRKAEPENTGAVHGRGIYVMKALMDEVRFEEGGVVVHMRKGASQAAGNDTKRSSRE